MPGWGLFCYLHAPFVNSEELAEAIFAVVETTTCSDTQRCINAVLKELRIEIPYFLKDKSSKVTSRLAPNRELAWLIRHIYFKILDINIELIIELLSIFKLHLLLTVLFFVSSHILKFCLSHGQIKCITHALLEWKSWNFALLKFGKRGIACLSSIELEELPEIVDKINNLQTSGLLFKIKAVEFDLEFHFIAFLQQFSSLASEILGENTLDVNITDILYQSVDWLLQKLSKLDSYRMEGPTNIVAILLTQIVRYFIEVLVLDEEDDHSFLFFRCQFIISFSYIDSFLSLQNIDKGTLNDLNDCLVQFEGIFELYLNRFIVVSINKLVECFELLWVSIPHPFSYLCQLCSDWSLLISVESLDLNITLVSKEVDNVIDRLIVYCFHRASVRLWIHIGVLLSDVVEVDSMLAKSISNEFLLLVLLLLFLLRYVADPPCLSRRQNNLMLCELPFLHLWLMLKRYLLDIFSILR